MSSETSEPGVPLDLEKLRELVALMEKHGLTEIDLQNSGARCRLRRGPQEVMTMMPPAGYAMPAAMPAPVAAAASAASPAAPATPVEEGVLIKSPTVGTFYASPAPGDEAFAKVGQKVTAETIVCIIEAMKVFNQIPAEVNGTILAVLAKSGDPVEYGQPLFRVKLG